MLPCIPYDENKIISFKKNSGDIVLNLKKGMIKLIPVDAGSIRVMYTKKEAFSDIVKPGLVELSSFTDFNVEENDDNIRVLLPSLIINIDKKTNAFSYYNRLIISILQHEYKRLCNGLRV